MKEIPDASSPVFVSFLLHTTILLPFPAAHSI
jgi:hypothetical protein